MHVESQECSFTNGYEKEIDSIPAIKRREVGYAYMSTQFEY